MKRYALAMLMVLGCSSADAGGLLYVEERGGSGGGGATCDGDDPSTFCNDCNPCTVDHNCTACEDLPSGVKPTIYTCGGWRNPALGETLPAFCAGHAGCQHFLLPDEPGRRDTCFPASDSSDIHPGHCCGGSCINNARPCHLTVVAARMPT